ncbi:hypothetical protein [Streptomyces canus]|uniref:hypothetical protein n=1 Tax=Streptomyces canus TaxID=58343 RepID=UPI0032531787
MTEVTTQVTETTAERTPALPEELRGWRIAGLLSERLGVEVTMADIDELVVQEHLVVVSSSLLDRRVEADRARVDWVPGWRTYCSRPPLPGVALMSPAPDERDRIRAAMDRILHGRRERSDGALTIVALALEAGVLRNALPQRHTDLKNEFYAEVRARGGTPDSERRLRTQVRRLKELRAADAEEIARLKADVEALHQATTENQLLRRQQAACRTVTSVPSGPSWS